MQAEYVALTEDDDDASTSSSWECCCPLSTGIATPRRDSEFISGIAWPAICEEDYTEIVGSISKVVWSAK